jgi:predicted lipoprotein with Yx(FWY)xxD motif
VGRSIRLAAIGLVAATALAGCSYGTAKVANNNNASPKPNPSTTPGGGGDEGTNQPAGILTASLAAKSIPKMGRVVTDSKGWVLYRFDKDVPGSGASACTGDCVRVWPPLLTDGEPTFKGVDPDKVGAIIRPDGGLQITLGGWPLYRYIGDPKPGAWKGQGVAGTWWVSAPDGKKNLTCVPKTTPSAVSPPPTGAANDQTGGSNY